MATSISPSLQLLGEAIQWQSMKKIHFGPPQTITTL